YFGSISSATGNTYNYTGLTPIRQDTDTVTPPAENLQWDPGVDYVTTRLSIAADEDLLIVSKNLATDGRGLINTLAIVAVPEPTSLAALGAAALLLRRKRR